MGESIGAHIADAVRHRLGPAPAGGAAWAEERGFTGLYVPEKTHVPVSRQIPWPGGELGWRRW
jgi:hypothetical protein